MSTRPSSVAVSVSTGAAAAEVLTAFEIYEDALQRNDVETMNDFFWDSEEVVRFGVAEEQWGTGELRRWRADAAPIPAGRSLSRTRVSVFGDDTAIVTTLFSYPGRTGRGRQSQTWFRFAEGWRIVGAHVSEIEP
jgi:ketosteroid isomerase-like protein